MAINFPTSLDSFSDKVDNTDDVMAVDINDVQDAVEALEAKVGVDNSAVSSSHDYKFSHLIPAGTIMLFGQNAAPTGWTRKTDWQDNAMICYAQSGDIGSGGAVNPQSAHTHTGPSHTHTAPSHRHRRGSDLSDGFGAGDFRTDYQAGTTSASGTGSTGENSAPYYQEVIACQKD